MKLTLSMLLIFCLLGCAKTNSGPAAAEDFPAQLDSDLSSRILKQSHPLTPELEKQNASNILAAMNKIRQELPSNAYIFKNNNLPLELTDSGKATLKEIFAKCQIADQQPKIPTEQLKEGAQFELTGNQSVTGVNCPVQVSGLTSGKARIDRFDKSSKLIALRIDTSKNTETKILRADLQTKTGLMNLSENLVSKYRAKGTLQSAGSTASDTKIYNHNILLKTYSFSDQSNLSIKIEKELAFRDQKVSYQSLYRLDTKLGTVYLGMLSTPEAQRFYINGQESTRLQIRNQYGIDVSERLVH